MDRRTVIKNLALLIAGATVLPSCVGNGSKPNIHLNHLSITAEQEKLISDVCETIIPKTDTPGAKDLHLHLFVIKMLDDCYNKKDQQAFMTGMEQFQNRVKTKYDKEFGALDVKDREALLTNIEVQSNPKAHETKPQVVNPKPQEHIQKPQKKHDAIPLNAFYWDLKQQTLFAYTTSQYFMTKQVVYELVPGRWNAHFPVKKLA